MMVLLGFSQSWIVAAPLCSALCPFDKSPSFFSSVFLLLDEIFQVRLAVSLSPLMQEGKGFLSVSLISLQSQCSQCPVHHKVAADTFG